MDVRLTSEQRQLRDAAAKLADELGPGSVLDLADSKRRTRLEDAVSGTGFRELRSDGASGVEVALVAQEFARGLVDVPFLGPVLADDLQGRLDGDTGLWTVADTGIAIDAAGCDRVLRLDGTELFAGPVGDAVAGADLTRLAAAAGGPWESRGDISDGHRDRWRALALTATCADLVGVARGAQRLAVEYAKVRAQYGNTIGSYQAVGHLLAESEALIEGSISVLWHAAWAVDELDPPEALRAARIAKIYTARAARTVCETAVQVHGGIGNTWECLAHVYLRRALVSTELFPVRLEEAGLGLS
ncbi:acyl-CoA dehydrogenase family protein [Nocardia sp. NBC_00416]|uniref:acyl-CoA dehydrogenase family protein n=1 Tax=Nocardia sp. NBC_00416 TaxID=2975991 RepID=UPI002E1CD424